MTWLILLIVVAGVVGLVLLAVGLSRSRRPGRSYSSGSDSPGIAFFDFGGDGGSDGGGDGGCD